MKDLNFDKESANLGGINQLVFFAENELNVFGDIINGQIHTILFLNENVEPAVANIVQESGEFKEEQLERNLFKYEFTAKIAKDDIDKRAALLLFDNNKVIIKVTDNNNEVRVLGEPGNTCIVTTELDKGTAISNLNHYKLKFTWKSRFRAPFANNLQIITANLDCDNAITPNAIAGGTWTTSIEITNNTEFDYKAIQIFSIPTIAEEEVEKIILPHSTEIFEVALYLPSAIIGPFQLIRSGVCNSQYMLNVYNYSTLKDAYGIQANEDTTIEFYNNDDYVEIDDGQIYNRGDAVLYKEDNIIKVQTPGTIYNLGFQDTDSNFHLFPLCENHYTVHCVKSNLRAFVNNATWIKLKGENDYHYNQTYGATKLTDTDTGIISYVPYTESKTKIFAE